MTHLRTHRALAATILFGGLFLSFATVHAQVAVGGTSVNPISRSGDLAQLVADLYDFAILTGGLLAFAVILYGAVKYTLQAGNPSALDDAKEWILQAFLGLLLLLGAWLVLNTINPEIVNITLPTLNEVRPAVTTGLPAGNLIYSCVGDDHKYSCSPGNKTDCSDTNCATNGNCRQVPSSICGQSEENFPLPGQLDDATARRTLLARGIQIKPGVSLARMNRAVLDETIALYDGCLQANGGQACDITVTSGSDGRHADGACSHGNGFKIDFRPNAKLDAYIQTFAAAGTRSDGARLYRRGGALYARESDHWDMVNGCPLR